MVQTIDGSVENDAGRLYILLVDASSDETVDQVALNASNAQYSFSFGGIEAGEYYLIAGTDNNNDGFICEPGESCGLYLSTSGSNIFSVSGDISTLNFEVGYDLYMRGVAANSSLKGIPVGPVDSALLGRSR